ncbi:Ig-like domain-containing protein [bacterium]|nr:Ig-like domain-containing protein [bacterium]
MLRLTVTCAAAAALMPFQGCAKPGPPPGGPLDEDPPCIITTEPLDGALNVALDSNIGVLFSEEMNRSSVERAVEIIPDVTFRNPRWKGPRLEIRPGEGLADSTTYVVRIRESARDYHSVSMEHSAVFAFSTGPSIDDGGILGAVTAEGEPVPGATIWACPGVPEPDSLGVLIRCGRETMTGESGRFALAFVRPSDEPYTLVAFLDGNSDGIYTPAEETGIVSVGAVTVATRCDTARGVSLAIRPPAAD